MTEHELRQRLEQMTHDVPSLTHQAFTAVALSGKENEVMKKRIAVRTVFVTAVIILLTLTTAIAATICIRVQMNTKEIKNHLRTVMDGAEVRFDPLTDEYVVFKTYRPMWVPEGYELTHVGEVRYGAQVLSYSADGKDAQLTLYTCRSNAGINRKGQGLDIKEVVSEERVMVGSAEAVLYTVPSGGRCLAWVDAEAGFGFFLTVQDTAVDLLRIAESVVPDPELASTERHTELALQLMGNYGITALPAGYSEAERSGWYSEFEKTTADMYIWYLNQETNDVIELEYSNARYWDADAELFAAWVDDFEEKVELVTVNGMNGIVRGNEIIWHDRNARVEFTIKAKHRSVDELLRLAESVSCVE